MLIILLTSGKNFGNFSDFKLWFNKNGKMMGLVLWRGGEEMKQVGIEVDDGVMQHNHSFPCALLISSPNFGRSSQSSKDHLPLKAPMFM